MTKSHLSSIDHWIIQFDRHVLSTISGSRPANRPYPAEGMAENRMPEQSRRQVEGFMRVNHAGEVSAQALYQGQAVTARDENVRTSMQESADEELDHLSWCRRRLDELNGRSSYLDPFWYLGSFALGSVAGVIGDKWSLGFIEETEQQVIEHLQSHLDQLPVDDEKTRAVLEQMKVDETHHRDKAADSGAAELPKIVKKAMALCSKVMTKSAYWV